MTRKTPDGLEKHLQDLKEIVCQMEQKNLPLEDALAQFARGVELVRTCQNILNTAEQKISILLKKQENEELSSF
jgi:exodeoxyribonuclease VII small subunit